ncbi:hypothetical protein HY251_04540, partial [bacterium]|nr:hypothetical protein [bacterium]
VDLIVSFIDLDESVVDLIVSFIDLDESVVDLIVTFIDLDASVIDLIVPVVHRDVSFARYLQMTARVSLSPTRKGRLTYEIVKPVVDKHRGDMRAAALELGGSSRSIQRALAEKA